MPEPAQHIIHDEKGHAYIEYDWYPMPLPQNLRLDDQSYPDTSYSFATFFSEKSIGMSLGYSSGNYGHSVFNTGKDGEIRVGKFCVLQCMRLVCNLRITIEDHCMFSWGSVVTDSWLTDDHLTREQRRMMLEYASKQKSRHIEFSVPKPVHIKENVWVGFDAIILPGVTIGRGSIVGSKSVIDQDVPDYTVVVGNPGRIVKYLEPTDTEEVKQRIIKESLA